MRSLTLINSLLEDHSVRTSPIRQLVLKVLLDVDRPISSLEIERILETVDRSSITRTLVLFVDKGLVHSFEDGSGSMKYEVCQIRRPNAPRRHYVEGAVSDMHPHFHCIRCGNTICLNDVKIPIIPLPDGFEGHSSTLIVKGICNKCH